MLEITQGNGDRRGLKYRGRVLHDADRATEEARDQVMQVKAEGKGLIVVFGLGLGYHIEELAGLWPQAKIVAFDPEPALQDAYAKHAADTGTGPDRLTIVRDWPSLNYLLTQEIVHGNNPDPAVFKHPEYQILFPKESEAFAGIINGARVRRAVMDKTIQEKGGLFLDNLADNLPDIMNLPLLTELQGRLPSRPGFIVGAGPGLEKNGDLLRNLDGRGLILAAASAWKPLLDKGVRPDMLAVVEAEDTSRFLRLAEPDPKALLALASTAHPEHFNVPGFNQSVYHLSQGAAYILGAETFAPQAGTAGTAAFTIGLLWGLNPLILIGQDQAFASDRLHVQGSPSPNPTPDEVTTFSVTGTGGDKVQT
ncbi:MAG: 6-hydroxymethylpterin diphosphokinase MptE-like protein, partial [Thermodesulfobacteriota bacterium]|nr:6-hydroxymethylpterin diphosphokinase MptE-like protein [Thermodesulfobacteriota bacterium]